MRTHRKPTDTRPPPHPAEVNLYRRDVPPAIRVVVAHSPTLFREALVALLSGAPGLQVVGAAEPEDAAAVARTTRAEVMVATENVPIGVSVPVLVVGGSPRRAIASGAAGYVEPTLTAADLVEAIRRVHAGERVSPAQFDIGPDPAKVLSPRELETLRLLAAGLTNREIAARLGISVKTIDTHRGHALKKLRLRNNADLTRFAIEHELVDLSARAQQREAAA
jgi:two-component system invasion response regulator UvrY